MLTAALTYHRHRDMLPTPEDCELRGFAPATWVAAEHGEHLLPVNALVYQECSTSRDFYFEFVQLMPRPRTWARYEGSVVDALYKKVFEEVKGYCHTATARNFDLVTFMVGRETELVEEAFADAGDPDEIEPKPTERQIGALSLGSKKIIRYEAIQAAAAIESELSQSTAARPLEVFERLFPLVVEPRLNAPKQGFTNPASPDFVINPGGVGDVKVGPWKAYFGHTLAAYALALEEHDKANVDFGEILGTELVPSRPYPIHSSTRVIPIDDTIRRRFLTMRTHRLTILTESVDPGRAANRADCSTSCPYFNECWPDDGAPSS